MQKQFIKIINYRGKKNIINPFVILFLLIISITYNCFGQSQTIEKRIPPSTIPASLEDFTKTQDFTGNASITVPLFTIGDAKVQLSYNSQDISNKVRTENQFAPSGFNGLGWQLTYGSISAEINATADTSDDRYFYNNIDGSFELQKGADGIFRIPDYKAWRIQRVMSGGVIAGWIITKEDGIILRFGNYYKSGNIYNFSPTLDSTYATRFFLGYNELVSNPSPTLYSSMTSIPYQWDLSDIQDIGGGHTTISYNQVLISLKTPGYTASTKKYTRESHPYKVLDNRGNEAEFISASMGTNEYYTYPQNHEQNLVDTLYLSQILIKGNGQVYKKIIFNYQTGDILSLGITKRYLTSYKIEDNAANSLPAYSISYFGLGGISAGINPGIIKKIVDPKGGEVVYSFKSQQLQNISLNKDIGINRINWWRYAESYPSFTLVTKDDGLAGRNFVCIHSADDSMHIYRRGPRGWYKDQSFPGKTSTQASIYNDYIAYYDSTQKKVAKLVDEKWIDYNYSNALNDADTSVSSIGYTKVIGVYANYFVVKYNPVIVKIWS